jgi:hypothetical protein
MDCIWKIRPSKGIFLSINNNPHINNNNNDNDNTNTNNKSNNSTEYNDNSTTNIKLSWWCEIYVGYLNVYAAVICFTRRRMLRTNLHHESYTKRYRPTY